MLPVMGRLAFFLVVACSAVPVRAQLAARHDAARDAVIAKWLDAGEKELLSTYQHLHAHPELSLEEKETAALVARELAEAGYEVTSEVGGHGVVAVLRNGDGPTLLVRGDMDALPVTEETSLPYASKVKVVRSDGTTVGVMHACGHDVHVTSLLGTAKLLAVERARWSGTLVVVAQPAEELGRGALMMIEAGLLRRFPRPDWTLALHVDSEIAAGKVAVVSGWAAANVDSVDITIHGRGGHGARPHHAQDPVVTAAHVVTALQTIVSRRIDPQDPAVVTVGSIHAGTKHNVIPDTAALQLTVRSYSEPVRRQLLDGIGEITAGVCRALGCPKPPEVRLLPEHTPAVYNDPALSDAARGVFRAALGEDALVETKPTMAGEDFGRYARALGVPGLQFRLGAVAPKAHERSRRAGTQLPSLHSSRFAPDARATLRTGVRALASLALALLQKR